MNNWEIEVFYDGECPLCMREIRMLMRRDHDRGHIRFTNIADPAFDPTPMGRDRATFMARIHGRLPSGEWVEGVEVFRRLYAAVGFGPLVTLSRLPGIAASLNLAYRLFAKNRLRLTGRCADGACEAPNG